MRRSISPASTSSSRLSLTPAGQMSFNPLIRIDGYITDVSKSAPAILDHLASLADTTRSRLLLLLDRHELTVSELCGIMQLPQSTVSRHLKALADSGWVSARADGTSHLYTMTRDELDAPARRLWSLVRDQVGPMPAGSQDQRRLQA